MKRYILVLLTLLAIAGLLLSAACIAPALPDEVAPPPPGEEKPSEEATLPPPAEEVPPGEAEPEQEELPSFPLTIVDDLGREVEIERLPQRIISLAPSNTEILFALGLEDRIVGVTQFCNYPEAAKAKPRVAGYSTPDIEKVVSLEPDLILAESIHEKTALSAMESVGLTVIVMSAKSLDTVMRDITLVGQITGKSRAAAQLVDEMRNRIKAVTAKTEGLAPEQRPRVLYVYWHDPIWTTGSETFSNDVIQKAGGVNIFADDFKKSRVVSLEAVIDRNPQVIIISGMGATRNLIYNSIRTHPSLSAVEAVINGRVYQVDGDLVERPGPRIVDGLEQVAKFIHPEIFGTPQSE